MTSRAPLHRFAVLGTALLAGIAALATTARAAPAPSTPPALATPLVSGLPWRSGAKWPTCLAALRGRPADVSQILSAKSGGLGQGREARHARLGARRPVQPA